MKVYVVIHTNYKSLLPLHNLSEKAKQDYQFPLVHFVKTGKQSVLCHHYIKTYKIGTSNISQNRYGPEITRN